VWELRNCWVYNAELPLQHSRARHFKFWFGLKGILTKLNKNWPKKVHDKILVLYPKFKKVKNFKKYFFLHNLPHFCKCRLKSYALHCFRATLYIAEYFEQQRRNFFFLIINNQYQSVRGTMKKRIMLLLYCHAISQCSIIWKICFINSYLTVKFFVYAYAWYDMDRHRCHKKSFFGTANRIFLKIERINHEIENYL
jgi:hypothetical protein